MFVSSKVPAKEEVHNLIFPNTPRQGVLLLPAAEAADFKNLYARGAIAPDTNVLLVERDENAFAFMKHSVGITRCPSDRLNFRNKHLHSVKIPFPIDLAFVDLCGNIGEKEYNWFKQQLAPRIIKGGTVSVTVALPIRQKNFITSYINSRWEDCKYEYLQILNRMIDEDDGIERTYEREISSYYVMLKEIFPQCRMEKLRYRSKAYTMIVFHLTEINV